MTEFIDIQALKTIASLQRPGKPDLLNRIVELFTSESPKAISSMVIGLENDDLQAVRNAAHTLKSSSAYVGAMLLSDRCRDLEQAAREGNHTTCSELGKGLRELYEDSSTELTQLMKKAA